MRLFAKDPQALTKRKADEIAANILQMIPVDGQDLNLTIPYLDFWMSLERGPADGNPHGNQTDQVS